MTALPEALAAAIDEDAQRFPAEDIRQSADDMSRAYRARSGIRANLSALDRAAYLAVRFPSTFAVADAVWSEALSSLPSDAIKSVLDVGAGPGTASLALAQHLDGVAYTYLERDAGWREIAERLALAAGASISFRNAALTSRLDPAPHDVVVASYALGELSSGDQEKVLPLLWQNARIALVIIEPGTPVGFGAVRAAREWALAQGAHAAAPCTHDAPCPMSMSDWCHRPVRVSRSTAHRAAKHASLGYEDEKFSYVVLTREPVAHTAAGRIVRKPMLKKGHVHLDLCTEGKIERLTVSRRDGDDYRSARDASWGDVWTTRG